MCGRRTAENVRPATRGILLSPTLLIQLQEQVVPLRTPTALSDLQPSPSSYTVAPPPPSNQRQNRSGVTVTRCSVANQGRRTAAAVATSADGHEAATARNVACATSWVRALCTQRHIPLPLPDNVPIHATAKHSAGRCSARTLTGWRRSTRRSRHRWEAVPAGSLQREEKSNPWTL